MTLSNEPTLLDENCFEKIYTNGKNERNGINASDVAMVMIPTDGTSITKTRNANDHKDKHDNNTNKKLLQKQQHHEKNYPKTITTYYVF